MNTIWISIVTIILSAVLGSFFKIVFDKIFEFYKIDGKSILKFFGKIVLFALRYGGPAFYLIYILFMSNEPIDKWLVVNISINIACLEGNFIMDIIFILSDRHKERFNKLSELTTNYIQSEVSKKLK
mgnify:CR=1 FL=1